MCPFIDIFFYSLVVLRFICFIFIIEEFVNSFMFPWLRVSSGLAVLMWSRVLVAHTGS